jgi:hypothetical protein
MALLVEGMKNAVIEALKEGADTAIDANKIFGNAVLDYICNNIEIIYGWAAVNPVSGVPDPTVVFTASVSGSGELSPSATFSDMLLKLTALIKGLAISSPTMFLLAPLTFNPAGVLLATMAREDAQDKAMTNFCTQIIASIKASFANPAPSSGTHGPFSGATTSMVIS